MSSRQNYVCAFVPNTIKTPRTPVLGRSRCALSLMLPSTVELVNCQVREKSTAFDELMARADSKWDASNGTILWQDGPFQTAKGYQDAGVVLVT